jgi:hypothetical protein
MIAKLITLNESIIEVKVIFEERHNYIRFYDNWMSGLLKDYVIPRERHRLLCHS